MPLKCSICIHPDREEINGMLITGTAYRKVAERFAASPSALFRHKQAHLPSALVKAMEAVEVASADTLLGKVRLLESEARRIQVKAEKAGDLRVALISIHEIVRIVELLGEMEARMLGNGDGSRLVVERTILHAPFAASPPALKEGTAQ
jgi:hypothetical protein